MKLKCNRNSNEILIKFTRSSHEIRVVLIVIFTKVERETKQIKKKKTLCVFVFVCKSCFSSPFFSTFVVFTVAR